MKFIADLHIHSHFSLATSKDLKPEYLDYWARIKGIGLVATGDFTHPGWIKELKEKLIPAERGLFKLNPDLRLKLPFNNPEIFQREVRFILSSEISSIYKKNGKVRKVHNLLYAPDYETVEKIQNKLVQLNCNITSDGRPIIGLDSRDLLEISLEASPDTFFIPAHIWTPWFSILGEKGGFDSVEECFGDLTSHIHALETGLSTDPALNWMCSFLDRYTLVSNSDAHSPEKLGRNANILDCDLDYYQIIEAIKNGDGKSFLGTIDLFPQEGKYHYDGHRKCNVTWNPVETLKNRAICPVCNKRVVVGVVSRIARLSDRSNILERPNRRDFYSIVPLPELLSEIYNSGATSKKVKQQYELLLQKYGSELDILLNHSPETFEEAGDTILAESIRRMRSGRVILKEGFDGEYGVIKLFQPGEATDFEKNEKLFAAPEHKEIPVRKLLNFDLKEYRKLVEENYSFSTVEEPEEGYSGNWLSSFNAEQKEAVMHTLGPALVMAGPGTGKTRVLTSRIASLVQSCNVDPASILAITFTNKAASEIYGRLEIMLPDINGRSIHVKTFHALGLEILKGNLSVTGRNDSFLLVGDEERILILKRILGLHQSEIKQAALKISKLKTNLVQQNEIDDESDKELFDKYQAVLEKENLFDLDDLIYVPYFLLKNDEELANKYRKMYEWILIDEFQDINYNQYEFIRLLGGNPNANIYAIGDPNQSIYGFRGAGVEFIDRFYNDFSEPKLYKLKKSYRCTDRILLASSQVLNLVDAEDALKGTGRGLKLRIDTHVNDRAEAQFIARTIDELLGGMQFHSMDRGLQTESDDDIEGFSDFAVLCRTRAQMEIISEVFAERNIPYQITGREAYYQHEPFKSIIDVLAYIITPNQDFLKVILDDKRIDAALFDNLKLVELSVSDLISRISEVLFDEDEALKSKLSRFLQLADQYGNNVAQFIRDCRLGTGIDTWEQKAGKVSILTIHASKGLEFACVFIPGCEQGIIPYTLYRQDTDFDEEKRLLYVGMTRASKYLYLSHAQKRLFNNRELMLPRSSFLENIEHTLFDFAVRERKKEKEKDSQLKLF